MAIKIKKKVLSKEKTPLDIDIEKTPKINNKEFIKDVAVVKAKDKESNLIGQIEKKKGFFKMFKKKEPELPFYEAVQPLLFLIRSSGNIDVFENVPDGAFNIEADNPNTKKKEKTGTESENRTKTVILDNQKLLNLPYGEEEKSKTPYNIRMWIAHEDEATSYPNAPLHDSSILFTFIRRIYINAGLLVDGKSDNTKLMFWLKIIAGIAIVGYLLWKLGIFDGAMASSGVEAVKTEIQNITASQALQNVAK